MSTRPARPLPCEGGPIGAKNLCRPGGIDLGHQPSADRSSTFLLGLEVRVLAAQLGELLASAAPALAGHLAARVFRLVGLPFQVVPKGHENPGVLSREALIR